MPIHWQWAGQWCNEIESTNLPCSLYSNVNILLGRSRDFGEQFPVRWDMNKRLFINQKPITAYRGWWHWNNVIKMDSALPPHDSIGGYLLDSSSLNGIDKLSVDEQTCIARHSSLVGRCIEVKFEYSRHSFYACGVGLWAKEMGRLTIDVKFIWCFSPCHIYQLTFWISFECAQMWLGSSIVAR